MKKLLTNVVPAPGARIGSICGPGEFAEDNAGIVLCQVENKWGSFAVVLMDSGRVDTCHGLNSGPGIGWHELPLREVVKREEGRF
jgi:hypothetical protein